MLASATVLDHGRRRGRRARAYFDCLIRVGYNATHDIAQINTPDNKACHDTDDCQCSFADQQSVRSTF